MSKTLDFSKNTLPRFGGGAVAATAAAAAAARPPVLAGPRAEPWPLW